MPLLASFHLGLCLGQEQGYPPLFPWPHFYPCAVAITLSSASKSFLWSVWALLPSLSDGVHLLWAVLTSILTHGVHAQLISVFHSCSRTPLGLLQPAHHLSLSALQGCWLTLRALRGAEYSPVHSQMPSAQPEPAPGREAGIWNLTRCLLLFLSKLSSFFCILELFHLLWSTRQMYFLYWHPHLKICMFLIQKVTSFDLKR